jgi:hypothetical protein
MKTAPRSTASLLIRADFARTQGIAFFSAWVVGALLFGSSLAGAESEWQLVWQDETGEKTGVNDFKSRLVELCAQIEPGTMASVNCSGLEL